MKKLFIFLFITNVIFSQQEIDSVSIVKIDTLFVAKDSIKTPITKEFFTDNDLKIIDSLLVDQKFNSPLIDTLEYVIDDKDIIGNPSLVLTTDLLKTRLENLNEHTPFDLSYNPALEKVINSY